MVQVDQLCFCFERVDRIPMDTVCRDLTFCEKNNALFHMVTASIISITSGRKYVYVSLRCYREGRCASNGVNKQSRRLDMVKRSRQMRRVKVTVCWSVEEKSYSS